MPFIFRKKPAQNINKNEIACMEGDQEPMPVIPASKDGRDDRLFLAIHPDPAKEVDINQVEALLKAGANPNRRIPRLKNMTVSAYERAILVRRDIDVMRVCQKYCLIKTETRFGSMRDTLLMKILNYLADDLAKATTADKEDILERHLPIINELIYAGARLNAQNKIGDTPLHVAARRDLPKVLDLFLAHLAHNPDLKPGLVARKAKDPVKIANKERLTPFQLAIALGHSEAAEVIAKNRPYAAEPIKEELVHHTSTFPLTKALISV